MESITPGLFSGLNYWAVLVAGLATFFLGGLWYSPLLFEDLWMNAHGHNEVQVRQMRHRSDRSVSAAPH